MCSGYHVVAAVSTSASSRAVPIRNPVGRPSPSTLPTYTKSWSEVNIEKHVWTVRAERMKAKREYRAPLVLAPAIL